MDARPTPLLLPLVLAVLTGVVSSGGQSGTSPALHSDKQVSAADFPVPAAGTEGNELRNLFRNPGMFQVDAAVLKNNHVPWLGEEGNLQFRFDFINVLNHGNLGPVDANMADGTFGKSTAALPARSLQLGIRVAF
jgi:hypothetical protein